MDNIKEKIKDWLLNISVKYIRYYSKDSNFIRHANTEYKIAWKDYENDEMQSLMCEQVNDLLALLNAQGDSGSSIGYKLPLFNKLAKFETITPLTFDDSEFGEPYCSDDIRQNKRDSRVFKKGDKYSFIDSFIKKSTWYIGDSNTVEPRNGGCWNGGIFVIPENEDMYYLRKDWIKDTTKFNAKSFYVPMYELECPKDWWMSFCKETDLDEYKEYYDFEKDYSKLEEEISFKDNKYRDDILNKIDIIKKHMYNQKSLS